MGFKKDIKAITSINVYLPENLDVDKILIKYKMTKSIHNNHKARIYFILDSLYHISFNRKWKEFYEEKGGYPLQAAIFKKPDGLEIIDHTNFMDYYSKLDLVDLKYVIRMKITRKIMIRKFLHRLLTLLDFDLQGRRDSASLY